MYAARARVGAAAMATVATPAAASCFFGRAQPKPHEGPVTTASALVSARSILDAAGIGFVCTRSSDGAPCCRVMDVKRLDDTRLSFSLVTRTCTRKAAQVAADSRVTLAFHDPRAAGENGYVALSGRVREVVEKDARRAVWKDSWTLFHTAPEVLPPDSDVLVYVFEPDRLELVDNERWLRGDWRPVTLVRTRDDWEPAPAPPRAARVAATAAARRSAAPPPSM